MTTSPATTNSLLALIRDGVAIGLFLMLLPMLFAVFTSDKTPKSFSQQAKAGCALMGLVLCFLDNSKGIFPNRWPATILMLLVVVVIVVAKRLRNAIRD